ncbi:caspase family protein [Thioclava sp. FR2]|uniref:caspase family protein n=1 Tax=Thioclava sp. FR2 TaxID=3445780 RepID=UPI003EB86323
MVAFRYSLGATIVIRVLIVIFGVVTYLQSVSIGLAQDRLALVIGNDSYSSLPRLGKARNDANAISATLTGLGFSVSLVEDADRRGMTRALSNLASSITPGDEVVFYYAGHGVEVSGRNFLLPTDAPAANPGDEAFLTAESVAVDDVLFTLQSRGARVTVLILDACRDNPFPKQGTRSAGGVRGLAPIVAPEGAFILFSAGTGQSALDALGPSDTNPNSVFTRALIPLLQAPGLPLQQIARSLKAEVESTAQTVNHKQRPAYYDELTGDFVLNAGQTRGATALDASDVTSNVVIPKADPCDAAAKDWQTVAGLEDPLLLRSFAGTHTACEVFSKAATERALALEIARGAPAAGDASGAGKVGIAASPGPGVGIAASPPSNALQPAQPVQTWRIKRGVSDGYMNARSGPGTTYPILFQIPEGTGGLLVDGCRKPDKGGGSRDVCLTTWGNQQGWVSIGGLEKE